MNPLNYIKGAALKVKNYFAWKFEGAERWSEKRQDIPGYGNHDAHIDIDAMSRAELVRKSRQFERNRAIVNKMADLFEQYTVGATGLQISAASSDEEWNQKAQEVFEEWQPHCDLMSQNGFATFQSLTARAWFIDGEVFILKTRGDAPPFRPRVQLIESHRIATPPAQYHREGIDIVDGIQLDKRGRPAGYWARVGFGDDEFRLIDAKDMIHVFEPSRPGQYRGIPFITPVINAIIDLEDLKSLEMDAAKANALIANVLYTTNGEVTAKDARRSKFDDTLATSGTTGGSATERAQAVANVIRSKTIALKTNEKFESHTSDRPTVTTQTYWDYVTWEICAGVGMSKLIVFPNSIQGTVARGTYELDNAFFCSRSSVLQGVFILVRNYVIDWERQRDMRIADAPSDWFKCSTRPPKAVNVDVGRNSTAILNELEAGLTTIEDEYAAKGMDGRVQITKRAREIAFIKKAAQDASKEYGVEVTPSEISSFAVTKMAPTTTEPDANGEPVPQSGQTIEEAKAAMDAYGVGVRAGAITPNNNDEDHFRTALKIPKANENVKKAWQEDGGVRRPITLVGKDGSLGDIPVPTEGEEQ